MIRPCEQLTAEGKESSSSVTDRDTWKQARGFGRRDISVTVMAKAYGTTPRKLFAIEFSVDPQKTGNIKSSRSNNCRSIVFALFSVIRLPHPVPSLVKSNLIIIVQHNLYALQGKKIKIMVESRIVQPNKTVSPLRI